MRKRRKPMKPIQDDEGKQLVCSNADFWPPPEIEYLADTAEELRYSVPDVVYQRLKTWEQVCGLKVMDASKCSGCNLAIIDGKPVTEGRTGKGIMNKRKIRLSRQGDR